MIIRSVDMEIRVMTVLLAMILNAVQMYGQKTGIIKYGDFNSWTVRKLKESSVIGGQEKTVYEIGPQAELKGNKPYRNMGGSPWATSNVYARVAGITKTSNAVYPCVRSGNDKCAKLCTQIESVKVLGMINMDVLVAGSMFLGEMIEPISSTSNPYRKMEMGIPFTKRPHSFVMDYKLVMPKTDTRVKSTGFGSKKTLKGHDSAVVFIYLQQRWEDKDGSIHARRIGTGGQLFGTSSGWVDRHEIPIIYGDCSNRTDMKWLGLRTGEQMYYARNSKGKLVPVKEDCWGNGNEQPTHIIVMISAGKGEPYVGTPGLTFYVDNVGFRY